MLEIRDQVPPSTPICCIPATSNVGDTGSVFRRRGQMRTAWTRKADGSRTSRLGRRVPTRFREPCPHRTMAIGPNGVDQCVDHLGNFQHMAHLAADTDHAIRDLSRSRRLAADNERTNATRIDERRMREVHDNRLHARHPNRRPNAAHQPGTYYKIKLPGDRHDHLLEAATARLDACGIHLKIPLPPKAPEQAPSRPQPFAHPPRRRQSARPRPTSQPPGPNSPNVYGCG